jgi:hypothetical protein
MRKYTMLRAKETSKSASYSLRKIVGVNISMTWQKKITISKTEVTK